jgi:hypothetical protein
LVALAYLHAPVRAFGDEPDKETIQALLDERGDRSKAEWSARELARLHDAGQRDAQTVAALVRARYFLATRWLPSEDEDAAEETLEEAVEAGLVWLGSAVGTEFDDFEELDDERARVRAEHVPVYYWTTIAHGSLIPYASVFSQLGSAREFRRSLERLVELDAAHFHGGPHRVLAEFLLQAPGVVGGDDDDAKEHARKALELGPAYVENHIVHAIVVTREDTGDEAYRLELEKAAKLPIDTLPGCLPEQRAARARAERLLRELGE